MISDLDNKKRVTDEDILDYAERLGHGEIHIKVDHEIGLKAIIAIHNLTRGPAIGGTRFIPYNSTPDAIRDALRLSFMMTYKSAICDLPHGGGKSVIMAPDKLPDRAHFFTKFGEFVDSVGGRYIAAMDSGTTTDDMDAIQKSTRHVTCTSDSYGNGDPSPSTATGVFRGLQASVKHKLNTDNLEGLRVAIQGVGHVGYHLAKLLHEHGAKLTVTDNNGAKLQRCVEEFNATPVQPNDIYDVDCDIYSPCALGATINESTVHRLKCKIVAGAANNQLAKMSYDKILYERGILYAPDFLINSGGIIHVAALYDYNDPVRGEQQINDLYLRSLELFDRAKRENRPTNEIAMNIAEEKLKV